MSRIEQLESRTLLSGAAGTLDQTFGHHGVTYITNQTPAMLDTVTARALSNGQTLLVGKGVVSRLNADGTVDTTYGQAGFVYSDLIDGPMDLDSQGRMIFSSLDDQGIYHLSRFNANGTFDRALFTGSDSFNDPLYAVTAIHALPDDSILLGGEDLRFSNSQGSFGIVKIRPQGGLDSTFGTNGKATTQFGQQGGQDDPEIEALAVDKRGRILAAGGDDRSFEIARFNRDGSLDSTFGSGGRAQIFGGNKPARTDRGVASGPVFKSMALGKDGEIFAAGGWPLDPIDPKRAGPMIVAAFAPDGKLDDHFGHGGIVRLAIGSRTAMPSQAAVNGLAITTSGQLLLAGSVDGGGITGALLARLNRNGSLDTTFATALAAAPKGNPALRFVPVNDGYNFSHGLATGLILRGNGQFLVPLDGAPLIGRRFGDVRIRVERFNANGNPDRSFGAAGLAEGNPVDLDANSPGGLFTTSSPSPVGTVVYTRGQGQSQHISRISDNGSLNDVLDFSTSAFANSALVAVQPDGKLIVEDNRLQDPGSVDLLRYNPDGTLDTTFGSGGKVTFSLVHGALTIPRVLLRSDGAMIVNVNQFTEFGESGGDELDTDTLHLIDASGNDLGSVNLGPGFTDIGTASAMRDFELASNGDVVVLTAAPDPQNIFSFNSVTEVHRFNAADLSPNLSFGASGVSNVSFDARAIATTADGEVIVASIVSDSHTHKPIAVLNRLDSSGNADASFGQGGTAELAVPGFNIDVLLVQADGNILLAFDALNYDGRRAVAIRRVEPTGIPDLTFGTGGTSSLTFGLSGYVPGPPPLFSLQSTATGQKLVIAIETSPAKLPRFNEGFASVGVVARINL